MAQEVQKKLTQTGERTDRREGAVGRHWEEHWVVAVRAEALVERRGEARVGALALGALGALDVCAVRCFGSGSDSRGDPERLGGLRADFFGGGLVRGGCSVEGWEARVVRQRCRRHVLAEGRGYELGTIQVHVLVAVGWHRIDQ